MLQGTELSATRLDVIDVKHTRAFLAQKFPQSRFPLDQRQCPQVLAIQKQQIEGEEHTLAPAKQRVIEHRPARIIDTGKLAINNRILHTQVFGYPLYKVFKIAERVAVAGDEFALAILDIGKRPEAIDLQLEDVIVGVERSGSA